MQKIKFLDCWRCCKRLTRRDRVWGILLDSWRKKLWGEYCSYKCACKDSWRNSEQQFKYATFEPTSRISQSKKVSNRSIKDTLNVLKSWEEKAFTDEFATYLYSYFPDLYEITSVTWRSNGVDIVYYTERGRTIKVDITSDKWIAFLQKN